MKFVLLFGPQAVGKMTVGQELAEITELKLLHNHMTIDLLEPFFGFEPEMWKLSTMFREQIFTSFARSNKYGMIFTYVWAFDQQEDWDFVEKTCAIFEEQGAEVFFVELEADLGERLERNKTSNRLAHKPTKRDTVSSEKEMVKSHKVYRLNSNADEIRAENYLRINNTGIPANRVARKIKEHFEL
ncbi:AAA family ATPase [Planococcus salinarum]|uniref:AAA family ATPase n=1 Tax=Planococcus salinarum TaxID=622695 RepID=UPI000E3D9BF0|nr:AAA family ATPase [Planococcus salinarum]TAA69775.1 shikimate kinase [Planococcus salinarum]